MSLHKVSLEPGKVETFESIDGIMIMPDNKVGYIVYSRAAPSHGAAIVGAFPCTEADSSRRFLDISHAVRALAAEHPNLGSHTQYGALIFRESSYWSLNGKTSDPRTIHVPRVADEDQLVIRLEDDGEHGVKVAIGNGRGIYLK